MSTETHSHSRSSSISNTEDHELSVPSSAGAPQNDVSNARSDHACYANSSASDSALDGTNFTFRGVLVGIAIGIIICFSNTYFGLQTGWVSGMAMPASLIGFAMFKALSRFLVLPFTPVENVLVQTVAGAVGTMPLGLGFVGVIPSLEFLLKKSEGAPIDLSLWRLFVWGVGLCLFGVVFGVPLRKQVIIRERLKFPSGTATALMISVLHGGAKSDEAKDREIATQGTEERENLLRENERDETAGAADEHDVRADWKRQMRLLLLAFSGSGAYTFIQYFLPILHKLPIFGTYLANTWVWTLNPSPAYVGQGIIMGPATTFHMLLGEVIGWGVLSPIAKHKGWAPGPVDDWETGSKGWIVWVSLAIMLADAVVNLGWLVLRPTVKYGPDWARSGKEHLENSSSWYEVFLGRQVAGYFFPNGPSRARTPQRRSTSKPADHADDPPDDAPPHHLVSGRTVAILLPLTLIFCVVCIHITFGGYIPIGLNILAILLALVLSIMGVRALGETDLNPVSGISKLTQLVFALVTPTGKLGNHAIVINLLAGAVSEAGALQAGDILQDLKAGHLIGASPKAQFYGQIIGSIVGAFVSAAVYKLYVSVYEVPGELFQMPTAYVWIFTARLVTGKGLPPMAWQFALVAGAIFVLTTSLRIYLLAYRDEKSWCRILHPWIPGGIAVAVGMYNTPSFTLARTVGGAITYWWVNWKQRGETRVIVLASGLILGEGVVSIVNLVLASLRVPHL
ncbi:OPT superfamily [Elasticomyces elasticus]|uniref:OPT superfamily n=1 Tax=Exophiala sideris TaxID=1016849 RepID=A0ABR0J5S8_9EURO|nr:OPT superfamily [Elasticomyces elasticus]KAK5035955.1 OPT superfamily [Exophiala sideris]KAK5056991.1 OPT superfamily [Exophiala sideris]KAK5181398.1 OPT superfamily [Eurotiomycetes sp. CCFEE 6388]